MVPQQQADCCFCRHRALIAYLTVAKLPNTAAALREELNLGEDVFDSATAKKYEGLIEKKWTSVVRLQKKVSFLACSHGRGSVSSRANPAPWLVDNGPRTTKKCPPGRARQRYSHLPQKQRPRVVAASVTGSAHPSIPSRPYNVCRLPPNLLISRIWIRGPDHQNMGLGAGRAGTNHQRPYKSSPRRRLRRPSRKHPPRILQFRLDNKTLGSFGRVQKYSNTSWSRPQRQCSSIYTFGSGRIGG